MTATLFGAGCAARQVPAGDLYKTPKGDLYVDLIGHGSVMLTWAGNVIQIDPYSQVADYAALPQADLVLITHPHYDHLDKAALDKTVKPGTHVISDESSAKQMPELDAQMLHNGQSTEWKGLRIDAVPAYNVVHKQPDGQYWHPKGWGNGYVIHFGTFALYIAGDTENIPEMAQLKHIDVAFMPKNLPYTMTDEMFVNAAQTVRPKVLYPYHYDTADKIKLQQEVGKDILIK